MALLSGFWSFILQDDTESYLDCQIFTKDHQILKTNKCFLIHFMPIKTNDSNEYPQDDELLTIMMPFHSCQEIYVALRGFCKTSSPYIVSTECEKQTSLEMDQSQSYKENKPLNHMNVDSREKSPLKEVSKTFQCYYCGKIFSNSKQLKHHKYQGAYSLKSTVTLSLMH